MQVDFLVANVARRWTAWTVRPGVDLFSVSKLTVRIPSNGAVAGGLNPRLFGGEGAFWGRRCGRTSMRE
jgi:hypothetical protein